MKVLCTSDWHLGIYGDPSDALKLSNDQLLGLLDKWEAHYDYILLNGDIFEVLKSARIKFSHYDQTQRVLEDRSPVVQRFLANKKYLWVVGNHDYTLEEILGLPLEIRLDLDHGFKLVAEHGHLIRAPKEHYSSYAWHFHLMYCLTWWVDRIGMLIKPGFCLDTMIAAELAFFRTSETRTNWHGKLKEKIIRLAFSYASLNSDASFSSLDDLFLETAQTRFGDENTLVTFGHSHTREIRYHPNNNIYLNAGSFCVQNNYSFLVISTESGKVEVTTGT